MKIYLQIHRYNPEKREKPSFRKYEVDVEPTDRLLDALIQIKNHLDSSLGFRRSCAHGVCGSDGMIINGKEALACKTLIQEVAEKEGAVVRVEPLRNLPVQRDLMVNQSPFFQNYRKVKPYQVNPEKVQEKERIQSPEKRKQYDDATKCILCAACFSACPVKQEKNPAFIGPAAIVQASRFIEDDRDLGFQGRLPELDNTNGVWPCENHFECTRVCPQDIKVTKLINLTKRRIAEFKKNTRK